jgi:hypothetical protein
LYFNTRADLKAFNRCWLFLGVMFLAEITTADGLSLAHDAWKGTRSRFSPLLYQPNPGPQLWQIWRGLLARTTLESAPKQTTPQTKVLYLLHPLGTWLPGSDWIFHKWAYSFLRTTGHIYHAPDRHYSVHTRQCRSRHRSQLFSPLLSRSPTTGRRTVFRSTNCLPLRPSWLFGAWTLHVGTSFHHMLRQPSTTIYRLFPYGTVVFSNTWTFSI